MRNSTIRIKKGVCIDCLKQGDSNEKYLCAKRCSIHYKQYRAGVSGKKKQTKKNTASKKEPSEIYVWYKQRLLECPEQCMNCGRPTHKRSPSMWMHSLAHVVEKGIFKSVSCHPENIIYLCSGCHTLYDRDMETASNMKVFQCAVNQFNKFRHEIKEKHSKLDLFIYYADKLNIK